MKGRAREINTQNGASAMVNPMRGAASRSGALATRLMSSNRQEIGLIVGCSREMVGRSIKALAQEGAIEVSGKNIVVRGTR